MNLMCRLWTSPDGQYAIEFIGLQLVIYKKSPAGSTEERLAVNSYPLEGNWISGEWSADSSKFTYVTEKDGVNVTKVYTVQEAVSSSPAASPVGDTNEHSNLIFNKLKWGWNFFRSF